MEYTGMKLSRFKVLLWMPIVVMVFLMIGCVGAPPKKDLAPTVVPETAATPEMTSTTPYKTINSIQTADNGADTTVTIQSDKKLTFSSVKQSFPLGVVLYFPQTRLISSGISQPAASDALSAIDTSGDANSGASKVAIMMKSDMPYEVVQDGTAIKVLFRHGRLTSSATPNPAPAPAAPVVSQKTTFVPEKTTDAVMANTGNTGGSPPIPMVSRRLLVNRIDFSAEGSGRSTVIIGTTKPVQYDVRKVTDTQLKIDLYNTDIPEYHQRQLITTRFESAVDRIIPAQTPKMKNKSVVSIELREAVPYTIEQQGNLIMVHFDASSLPPRPLEDANLPSWKKILDQPIDEMADMAAEAEDDLPQESDTPVHTTDQYFEKKIYTGEKIALDFYETDIKNVFRILREISGKNFIIDDDVKGKVTMTLEKPVPWDQILDLVLKMNQLGLVYEGDIIRIANLTTIKKESNAILDSISAEREAKEKIKDMAPLMTEYIAVSYSNAKDEVLPHLQTIITEGRGTISVDERNNQIIITDTAEKISQAKQIVKNIDKVTPQVIIEAKIVEVNKTFAEKIGVDWGLDGGIANTNAKAGVGPQRGMHAIGGTYGWNSAMNFPAAGGSTIGFNFTRIAGTPFVLNAELSAIESNDDGKIISAPKIVTLDNKKAKIKQGLEVGYYDTDPNNTTGRTVEFKNIDLLLEVTPHVTPDARVSMSIFITKNDATGNVGGIPTISTNEAETELLVNDGDTIVIGGIMKTSNTYSTEGFPVLSKIPGIGRLFKSTVDDNRNSELLIFITPRIVQLEQRGM